MGEGDCCETKQASLQPSAFSRPPDKHRGIVRVVVSEEQQQEEESWGGRVLKQASKQVRTQAKTKLSNSTEKHHTLSFERQTIKRHPSSLKCTKQPNQPFEPLLSPFATPFTSLHSTPLHSLAHLFTHLHTHTHNQSSHTPVRLGLLQLSPINHTRSACFSCLGQAALTCTLCQHHGHTAPGGSASTTRRWPAPLASVSHDLLLLHCHTKPFHRSSSCTR